MEWWNQWKMETIVGYKLVILYKVFSIRRSFKTINKTKEREGGFLPAPAGTKWNEVKIEITEQGGIKIWVNGKSKTYNLEKFKKEIISQPKIQDYLFKIINSGGIFTKDDIAPDVERPQFRNYVTRLRKRLQEVFGILDEPLPFSRQAYRAQFSVSSKFQK